MKKKVIAGVILGAMAMIILLAVVIGAPSRPAARNYAGRGTVGVIYIEGTIMSGRSGGGIFGSAASSEEIAASLRDAARNPELKAVVVRLNSPGGTAAGSQEVAAELDRLKKSGKKVVASMGDTAASGAYWIASQADQIVANPGTITGSIGVIMQAAQLQELYGKLGVGYETFKSGSHKDMGSPAREVTPEERVIFQSMIDDIFEQFVKAVAAGRGKDVSEISALADGRVFTGRQAKEAGLVDRLGDFHDAVKLAGEMAGIRGEPTITEIGPRKGWRDLLSAGARGFIRTPAEIFQSVQEDPVFPVLLR